MKFLDWSGIIVSIIFVVMIIVTTYAIAEIQSNEWKMEVSWCNNHYGEGNWTMAEITGTKESKDLVGWFYPGQVWKCKPNGVLQYPSPIGPQQQNKTCVEDMSVYSSYCKAVQG